MTNATEAKLAREAEICYSTLALVTDYDCWHEEMESVTVEGILEILKRNVELSQRIIGNAVPKISASRGCSCASAVQNAVITSPEVVSKKTLKKLPWLEERINVGSKRKRSRSGRGKKR